MMAFLKNNKQLEDRIGYVYNSKEVTKYRACYWNHDLQPICQLRVSKTMLKLLTDAMEDIPEIEHIYRNALSR